MTSSGRELLKWLALVAMTCDHIAQVFYRGYVPFLSEVGRIAFPVFALVMAYNLAQGADAGRSMRRLLIWGVIAQPAHALAFGSLLPLNVLLSFAVAAGCVLAIQSRQWLLLLLLAGPVALFVDYAQAGLMLVLAGWWFFSSAAAFRSALVLLAFAGLCAWNGNAWAMLALPVLLLGLANFPLPRTRWAFYGYYVGHLSLFAGVSMLV